jgi:hypothetical protein
MMLIAYAIRLVVRVSSQNIPRNDFCSRAKGVGDLQCHRSSPNWPGPPLKRPRDAEWEIRYSQRSR